MKYYICGGRALQQQQTEVLYSAKIIRSFTNEICSLIIKAMTTLGATEEHQQQ